MANIAEFLKKIAEARYGKDVRDSIHDGIEAINCEVETNTEASNNAVNAAKASATSATNAEAAANKAKSDVETVKSEIYETAIPQINQIKNDTETIKAETEQLKTDTKEIKDDTQQIKDDAASIEKACAKYAEKCENATAGLDGGTIPCGSLTFEELPDLADVKRGWMYNVSNEFMTTEDFLGGADFYYPPGTNVCAILNDGALKWDCFGGEMSGYLMKRDFESALAEAKIEFDEPAELKVASGITTIKNLFGNVAKIIKLLGKTDLSDAGDDITSILKSLLTKVGNTDISGIGDGTITGGISMLNSDCITLNKKIITSSNRQTLILTYDSADAARWEPICVIDNYGAVSVYNTNSKETILVAGNASAGCSISVVNNQITITFKALYSFRWVFIPSASRLIKWEQK